MITITIGENWRPTEEDSWKKDLERSKVIQFYVDEERVPEYISNSFSYIYDSETDEIEFSFDVEVSNSELNFTIYYIANERKNSTDYVAATISIGPRSSSTAIIRIPAYGRNIREIYEDNKSISGFILPGDYNPTLGSNFYKDSGENAYITKDTYEDFIRSSNIKGHILDDVGRKQFQAQEGYYKIIKTLVIRCNELERTVDSDGNYYSADRSIQNYMVYGIYTYDLYDSKQNLLRENVIEVTPHIVLFDTTNNHRVVPERPPYLGNLEVPDPQVYTSYNNTYVGQLFYEDFDGILRFVQSSNHITLERFIAVELEETGDGTQVYRENDYPLYIVGPNRGDYISFIAQVKGEKVTEEIEGVPTTVTVYPEGSYVTATFYNRQCNEYFKAECSYKSDTGKLTVKIIAREQNNETDPFRPSYAKILPILEKTNFKIWKTVRGGRIVTENMTIPYYVIQKSSKIGIIPKKYLSKESETPIDLPRDDDGKYLLEISEGIGVKIAYLGITSEVDPYDRDIVRNWSIREDMSYTSDTGKTKVKDREYFFENYTGEFDDKIVFITGSYDGRLSEFYIRDYIDRSDVWRRALYESEVTVVPIIDNVDKTVDLGGGWSYTLDTETNYFIGTNLLYLFNEGNRYYTQRFNLVFTSPEHTGPDYSNFRASINNFSLLGSNSENPWFDEEEGTTYTYYDNPMEIYRLLFGGVETSHELRDREKDSGDDPPLIEVKQDDNFISSVEKAGKYLPITFANTDCPALDSDGNPRIDYGTLGPRTLYLKVGEIDINNCGWEAVGVGGLVYTTPHYVHVTKTDTGYPAIDPETKKQKLTDEEEPLFIPLTTTNTGWIAYDIYGDPVKDGSNNQLYVDVTTTETAYPTVSGNQVYLDLTTEETGYPAFDSSDRRIRNSSNYPMSISLTTTDTGWATEDIMGNPLTDEFDNPLYVNVTNVDTGYQAYAIIRHKYVDKYQSLVEIQNTSRKRIFFCFEDIIDRRIVKFDIIYPQDFDITTKDIIRIPTTNPLRFVFKLIATSAVYEMQEIRFYCGIEGIQPLKLLSDSDKLYPDPRITDYVGYPEVELEGKSTEEKGISKNLFNVISETYSDSFPDWKLISAYNTFKYSAPNGNEIVTVSDNNGLTFEDTNSYLQIESEDDKGGTDFIDFIRVREGMTNWWDDWRFFIYNKFTNRFSLYCSTGSSEFKITDGTENAKNIKNITFDKIGLYRLYISTSTTGGSFKKLTINQTSKKLNNLYITSFSEYYNTGGAADPKRPKYGTITDNPTQISPNTPISINTYNPNGTQGTSFVLYLLYTGCTSKEQIKSGEARLEFEYTVRPANSTEDVTYLRTIPVLQTPQNGSFGITNADSLFKLTSYKFNSVGGQPDAYQTYGDRRFSVKDSIYGIPIFKGIPGKIELSYGEAFPYRLGLTIGKNDEEGSAELEHSEKYEIDSPLRNSTDTIELDGCYIKGSFIKATHEFKTSTFGQSGDSISNLPEQSWDIGFIDGRGDSKHSTLYYYPPINYKLLQMISSGARNSKMKVGRDNDNFIINAGSGQNNHSDPENVNTFYYGYLDKSQLIVYPELSELSRLVLNIGNDSESLPLTLRLLTTAICNGSAETISDPSEMDGDTLYLKDSSDNSRYAAIKWTVESNNSIKLKFYNDADQGSTNIPLKLLNMFSSIADEDINKGWITTAKVKLNLKVTPPRGMSESDFELMMIDPSDTSYPRESQWFGLGQSFVNKIETSGVKIQASSSSGKENNPRFTIPLSWFNNQTTSHTVRLKARYDADLRYANCRDLIFGVEVYEKDSTKLNQLGNLIANVDIPSSSTAGEAITVSFDKQLTTDVVLVPKFTNIEYNCFHNILEWDNSKIKTFKKIEQAHNWDTNIGETNKVFSETTDSSKFLGIKIKDTRGNLKYLNNAGTLTVNNDVGIGFIDVIGGFLFNLLIWVDNNNTAVGTEDASLDLERLGYQFIYLIQPGTYYEYVPSGQTAAGVNNIFYKIWYKFRPQGYTEIDGSTVQGSVDGAHGVTTYLERTAIILFPDRNDTLYMELNRGGAGMPNTGDFYIEEFKIQVMKIDKRLCCVNPGSDIVPAVSLLEDYHVVARKTQRVRNSTYDPGVGNDPLQDFPQNQGIVGDNWYAQDLVPSVVEDDDGVERGKNIAGPYPVELAFSPTGFFNTIGNYFIQFKG